MTKPDKYRQLKHIARISARVFLIICISLILLEIVLGIVFRIKDRNLIEAEASDYPYLYFLLTEQQGERNCDGFKTHYTREKPDSVIRIAITGGSVAYGNQAETTIAAQLETMLNKDQPKKQYEVINAGVPAYVIEQEFIMIQLVLQYYKPDIIVSLSGYNDLISADINRSNEGSRWLAPHNWDDFRCIETNKNKKSVSSRFFGLFPNIARLLDFGQRRAQDDKHLYEQLEKNSHNMAQVYAQRVTDIHAFCAAKGIAYIHCLQPVNWEFRSAENPERNQALQQLYTAIQSQLDTCTYCHNFTSLFANSKTVFTDECHVTKAGNKTMAEEIRVLMFK